MPLKRRTCPAGLYPQLAPPMPARPSPICRVAGPPSEPRLLRHAGPSPGRRHLRGSVEKHAVSAAPVRTAAPAEARCAKIPRRPSTVRPPTFHAAGLLTGRRGIAPRIDRNTTRRDALARWYSRAERVREARRSGGSRFPRRLAAMTVRRIPGTGTAASGSVDARLHYHRERGLNPAGRRCAGAPRQRWIARSVVRRSTAADRSAGRSRRAAGAHVRDGFRHAAHAPRSRGFPRLGNRGRRAFPLAAPRGADAVAFREPQLIRRRGAVHRWIVARAAQCARGNATRSLGLLLVGPVVDALPGRRTERFAGNECSRGRGAPAADAGTRASAIRRSVRPFTGSISPSWSSSWRRSPGSCGRTGRDGRSGTNRTKRCRATRRPDRRVAIVKRTLLSCLVCLAKSVCLAKPRQLLFSRRISCQLAAQARGTVAWA